MNKDPKILSKILFIYLKHDIKQKLPTMIRSFGFISEIQGWFQYT